MTINLPAAPSAFPGFHRVESRPDFQAAEASLRRFWKTWRIAFVLGVLVFLAVFGDWEYEIVRWRNFFNLIFAIISSVSVCGFFVTIIGNSAQQKKDAIYNAHRDQTLSLIVTTIRDRTSSQSDWRWLSLCNAGSVVFFTSNVMGIINLNVDRILYIFPEDITDCRIESRNVGSTTQIQGSAVTVGGGVGHALGAYTAGSATSSTQQHYSHVVDIYTRVSSASHLPLYFGTDEVHAKEAYGRVRALLTS